MAASALPLDAIGEGSRRELLELLRERPRAVGELAARMPISQPAVSQHLSVLRGAGLVTVRQEGRRRIYTLRPEGLFAVRAWVDSFWTEALDAFGASFETTPQTGEDR